MSKIKTYFLSRAVKKAARKKMGSVKLMPFSEMKTMVLLCSWSPEESEKNCNWLKATYGQFSGITIFNLTSKISSEEVQQHIRLINFSPKDFNFVGQPNKILQSAFEDNQSDLLINIHEKGNLYLDFIAASMPARLKTGCGKNNASETYTINIQHEASFNFSDCMLQVKKYINALTGKPKTE
jgi:hypothetical protein